MFFISFSFSVFTTPYLDRSNRVYILIQTQLLNYQRDSTIVGDITGIKPAQLYLQTGAIPALNRRNTGAIPAQYRRYSGAKVASVFALKTHT